MLLAFPLFFFTVLRIIITNGHRIWWKNIFCRMVYMCRRRVRCWVWKKAMEYKAEDTCSTTAPLQRRSGVLFEIQMVEELYCNMPTVSNFFEIVLSFCIIIKTSIFYKILPENKMWHKTHFLLLKTYTLSILQSTKLHILNMYFHNWNYYIFFLFLLLTFFWHFF